MSDQKTKLAKCSSADFRVTLYGILNAQGDFWAPLAFDSEAAAKVHIVSFWGANVQAREQCLRTHRIVPVRVNLTERRS